MESSGLLFVLSGPSGVGKDAILERLIGKIPNLVKSISVTTRPMRKDEKDGENYFFVDENKFNEMINRDEFLEWARVHSYLYGTPKSFVEENLKKGIDVLLKIDVHGGTINIKIAEGNIFFILSPP
jgi:guanylate kinase